MADTKRCPRCETELPAEQFRVRKRFPDGHVWLVAYCRPCERAYKRAWNKTEHGREAQRRHSARNYQRIRKDPERLRVYRERDRDRARRRHAANPEKFAEATRRWRERVKADPDRNAAHLANRRIYLRLMRERETGTLAVGNQFSGAVGAFAPAVHIGAIRPLLDIEPLRQWLTQRYPADWTHAEIAAEIGLDETHIRRIRYGEVRRISLHTADHVFVNAGAPHLLSVLYPLEAVA